MANDKIIYTGLDATHISTNLANYEAARSGFFNFIVPATVAKFCKYTYTDSRSYVYDASGNVVKQDAVLGVGAQEALKLNVTAASIPDFSLETLQYARGNEIVKYAGKPTWNNGELKIDDIVGLDTRAILMAWKGMAYNVHTRRGGRMKDYKIDCQLVEYTQDYVPVRIWDVYGCWVSDVNADGFDKENDGKRQVTATLQFDRAVMKYDVDSESVYNS